MGPIPDECNGLELINKDDNFCKENCRWSKKKVGRPATGRTRQKSQRILKIWNSKPVTIVIETETFELIAHKATERSILDGVNVGTNQIIRETLQKAFPGKK